MNKIKRILGLKEKLSLFQITWLFAPVFLWFSFHPFIRFGRDSTMNYEISIAVVYIVILMLAGVWVIIKNWPNLVKSKAVILVGLLMLVMAASLIWTPNPIRGFLTL